MNARALLLLCGVMAAAAPASAQVFSPGPISKAHASLEGLGACTRCHEEGGKHNNQKCLECHKEIGARVQRSQGYHARIGNEDCATCHREHKGVNAKLIEWTPSKRTFPHAQTGWPLQGAHRGLDCDRCHEGRLLVDDDIKALVKKTDRDTFLGLDKACSACHFDEHRGQLGERCEKCHTTEKFDGASLFNHNKDARFGLTGRHKKVACDKCHGMLADDVSHANDFPKPKYAAYMQMKDVPHASCTACHDDPHRGQFGKACARCHTTDGWGTIKQNVGGDFGFHDKTDFPLRGEHTSVACKSCHGPSPGKKAVFKGLKHAACADCHMDAHLGQLDDAKAGKACDRCHQVTGFTPVLFDVTMHKDARWPLDGAHGAVACNKCHTADAKLPKKVAPAARKERERQFRKVLLSETRLDLPDAGERCEACHKDPHGGQFGAEARAGSAAPIAAAVASKGCRACHQPTAFADELFAHDDSAFPLVGKHQEARCGRCHQPAPGATGRARDVVVYRPLPTTCTTCHADEHLGQLAQDGVTDCARCHQPTGFKPARFDHNDPKQSAFALTGKHQEARCAGCHVEVEVAGGDMAARYKPVATACAGCHEDEHRGGFDAFVPDAVLPVAVTGAPARARCDACHTPAGFAPARFDHGRTGFPLRGRHDGVGCGSCHGADYQRPVPQSCAGCHQDPHAQEFGLMCASCHSEEGFNAPRFSVDAHRRTAFPLTGRHGGLPCEECHVGKRDRDFSRAAADCISCHRADAQGAAATTVSHQGAPFVASCQRCHSPVAFTPARLAEHDACFPIERGSHRGVSCAECHRALAGTVFSGTCAPVPVQCTECHTHSESAEAENHREVAGYAYVSARCASCHRAE